MASGLAVFLVFTMMLVVPAYASGAINISGTGDKMMEGYRLIRNVAAALAAGGIAISALMALLGSSKEAEKAVSSIRYIVLALICILILPAVVTFGKTLLGS